MFYYIIIYNKTFFMEFCKRKNSEKKIDNNKVHLIIGTTNRNKPQIVYVNGKTYISPTVEQESYLQDISDFKKFFKKTIKEELRNTSLFSENIIFDFQVPSLRIMDKKKTCLTFQFLFKQNNPNNLLKLKDLKLVAEKPINNIIDKVINDMYAHNFVVYKNKN